jgi:hypothetical protein
VAYAVVAWFVLPHFDRFGHVGEVSLLAGGAAGAILAGLIPVRSMIRSEAPQVRLVLGGLGVLLVGGAMLALVHPPVSAAALLVVERVGG